MTSSVSPNFYPIQNWTDVIPFAGKVVAYQTSSYYYGAHKGYTIENVHFGYINETFNKCNCCGENGHTMTKVLKFQDVPSDCILITSKLNSNMSMRLATKKEIKLIDKAISANQAKLEYIFDKEKASAILKQSLNSLKF